MLEDRYGLPLSTTSHIARDAYVDAVDCILAAIDGAQFHLRRALDADPRFALAHIALARTLVLRANVRDALAAAANAREFAAGETGREQGHIEALALGIEGKPAAALDATHRHLARHPRDAMVLAPATGVFGLIGFSGRQQREEELLALLSRLAPHYGDDWWFQGALAFAACECGRLDTAWDLIERSAERNPRSANGAHIRAHVLYERGEPAPALDYLDRWMPGYARQGVLHCHLSWHRALCALELGLTERAWDIFQSDVHPDNAWGPPLNVTTDASSFLWRWELAGLGRRSGHWKVVHDSIQASFPKPGIPFVDVHRAVALAAVGDTSGAQRLVDTLQARVEVEVGVGVHPANEVVATLSAAFTAHAAGEWEHAIRLFETALADTVRIGGSRAQRDLVEFTLIAACLKARRADDARRIMTRRTDRKSTVNVAGFATRC